MEPIDTLQADLLGIIGKYTLHLKRFEEFHGHLEEKDNRVDIFKFTEISELKDNEFFILFLGREYRVTFSIAIGQEFNGCVSCYIANAFPDIGFSHLESFHFASNGHADIFDSENVQSYTINERGSAYHILFHWLRISFDA